MKYPKIKSIRIIPDYKLEILFDNNIKKIYDCARLFPDDNFKPLLNTALFNNVQVDKSGFGIVWNTQIDLSESELWINGQII